MVKNIEKIADGLGAKVVSQVPNTGGGAFGAARLAKIVETIQARPVELTAEEATTPQPHQPSDFEE